MVIVADDDYKLKSVIDILHSKMARRGVSMKNAEFGKVEPAAGGTVRQTLSIKQGMEQDVAKQITKLIRESKLKVKSQIQGDQIRVIRQKQGRLAKSDSHGERGRFSS